MPFFKQHAYVPGVHRARPKKAIKSIGFMNEIPALKSTLISVTKSLNVGASRFTSFIIGKRARTKNMVVQHRNWILYTTEKSLPSSCMERREVSRLVGIPAWDVMWQGSPRSQALA